MKRFFQIPNFKRDDYNRPDQKWVCGRACDGKGCQFGPDANGKCHTTGECRPAKQGDRWTCTRPETHGGTCPSGPLPNGECCRQIGPCQPVLSLRARRGRWVWAAAVLTLGLLLVLVGADHERWTDPGPLSAAHALSNARCSDCHQTAAPKGTFLAGGFLDARHPSSMSCLKCHDLGAHPTDPHGLDNASLNRARRGLKMATHPSHSVILAVARFASPSDASRDCVICHTEHHGRLHALTAFSDKQCQVCHTAAFDSFSDGHPEFAGYPFVRRTRLVFDHAKHLGEHFTDKAFAAMAPKDCSACHVPTENGGSMLVRSFQKTCEACHGAQIEGEGRAGDKGIAFFRVPGIDVATLEAKGLPVGEWPADADGPITPFTRLLLAGDKAGSEALRSLAGVDLTDLRNASPAHLAAAETLAWAIKSLFADLATSGQEAIILRLGAMDPKSNRRELRAMTAGLPRDGLLSAQAAWFPSLFTEFANYKGGIKPATKSTAAPAAPSPALQAAASAGDGDLLDDKPAAAPAMKPKATDDILDDAPPAKATPKLADKPVKAQGDDLLGDDTPPPSKGPAKAADASARSIPPLKVEDAETWTPAGGWYRSADSPTLYYRPVGHADSFLTLWITVSSRLSAGEHGGVARPLFEALSDPKAPGLCMKCHSVDRVSGGESIVNWTAAEPRRAAHEITKFNHQAHFSLMDQKGCQTCHQMKAQSAYLASFGDNMDPAHFESGFSPVAKATCASCHNDKVAGQSCQLCHVYHVGEVTAKIAGPTAMKPLD
jgi:hypothetical protein